MVTTLAAQTEVDNVFASVADELVRGEDLTIAGFGRFSKKSRESREGGNPKTGARPSPAAHRARSR